jgi:hypothetical protein
VTVLQPRNVAPCCLKSAGLMLYAASPLVPLPEIPLGVMERLSNESTKSERRDALGHNGLLCHVDSYALLILILAFFNVF